MDTFFKIPKIKDYIKADLIDLGLYVLPLPDSLLHLLGVLIYLNQGVFSKKKSYLSITYKLKMCIHHKCTAHIFAK